MLSAKKRLNYLTLKENLAQHLFVLNIDTQFYLQFADKVSDHLLR